MITCERLICKICYQSQIKVRLGLFDSTLQFKHFGLCRQEPSTVRVYFTEY